MNSIAFHLNCLTHGGTERVVSNLANRFAAEGVKVYVATEWQDEEEFELDGRVKRVHVGLREGDETRGRAAKILLRIKYLKEFLKKEKPDILVAFMQKANYRALTATLFMNIPTVVCVRIDPTKFYNAVTDKLLIRWLFPRAAGGVFQTGEQREFFAPWLQDNSEIILNPINGKYIDVSTPPYDDRDKAVVHAARLVDFKDQQLLIKAFVRVHEKHPDYCLRIYGPDSGDGTKQLLERLIEENRAQEWITLMGDSASLERELPRGRVYVSSSLYEGLPNSVLEAMALGMPVISTDCPCGGPREIIRNGKNGLLVPISDERALTEAINRLIEDPQLAKRLGLEAARIKERAETGAIYKKWRDYLDEVIERYGERKR